MNSTTDGKEKIVKNLRMLGIEPDVASVYIELTKLGSGSALQIARQTNIARTQIYRHLESLKRYGLVSIEKLSYSTLFRALPLENIEGLIANREAETAEVKKEMSSMVELLRQMVGGDRPKATVQHYYGLDGLKQVNWNLTKANNEYRIFQTAYLSNFLGETFARRYNERIFERNITIYTLTNNSSVNTAKIEPHEPSRDFWRYINPEVLNINFEACLYDDIVTLLDYSKERQMAIEIHHPALNAMMTQLFNAVWAQAKPLHDSSSS